MEIEDVFRRGGNNEPIHVFYNSDELMVELLDSPIRSKSSEKGLFKKTSKAAVEIMKAPCLTPEKTVKEEVNLNSAPSFTPKFSDGILVTRKVRRRKSERGLFSSPKSKKRQSARRGSSFARKDIKNSESDGDSSSRTARTLPPRLLTESPSWGSINNELSDELLALNQTLDKKLHHRQQKGQDQQQSISEVCNTAKNTVWPKAVANNLEQETRSQAFRVPETGGSRRTHNREGMVSPARSPHISRPAIQSARRQRSKIPVSPVVSPMSPYTPRSAKRSIGLPNPKHKKFLSLPMVPFDDRDGEGETKSPKRKGRPLIRPLDKVLMRNCTHGSATTATTFFSADTDAADYCMSMMFPVTKTTELIIFRKSSNKRDISIQRSDGEIVGTVDYSMVNQGKRIIKDAFGRTCAAIFLKTESMGGMVGVNVFKICGNKPASRSQRLSNETGYYTWAEVKNTGVLGAKFVMDRFSPETLSCSADQHSTKTFGSLFNKQKDKGCVIFDSKKKECTKMASLENRDKGILVGPRRDLCLILAFCAVVDEMMERRLR